MSHYKTQLMASHLRDKERDVHQRWGWTLCGMVYGTRLVRVLERGEESCRMCQRVYEKRLGL